jgi:hypothetical protein
MGGGSGVGVAKMPDNGLPSPPEAQAERKMTMRINGSSVMTSFRFLSM